MRDGIRFGAATFTLALMLTGPMAGTADAERPDEAIPTLMPDATAVQACDAIFGPDAFADVPARALVSPGERLSLDQTWGTGWKAGAPVEVVNCMAVDGVFSDALSSRNRGVTNDGLFLLEFDVPVGPEGARLCRRAVVIGQSAAGDPKRERLEAECLTVTAAAAGSSNDAGGAANRRQDAANQSVRTRTAAGGASPPSAAPHPSQLAS